MRRATLRDIPAVLRLINDYAARQIMLPRTEFEMAENIRDFVVSFSGDRLLGCGALHFYTPSSGRSALSLAVAPSDKKLGIGRRIVEALEADARDHGLGSLFAFTVKLPGFFEKLGYAVVDRGKFTEGLEGLPALPEVPGVRRDRDVEAFSGRARDINCGSRERVCNSAGNFSTIVPKLLPGMREAHPGALFLCSPKTKKAPVPRWPVQESV